MLMSRKERPAGNIIPANLVAGVSIALVPQCGATLSEGKTKPPKPFTDEAQLGVTGEDLLKALVPISGDIAPMVYVNDTLYQIVDSQPNFADEKSSFNLLGKIENTVSSSEEPKENFQANDDIVGAAVYQYDDNIVVEFEGKYWLYEHYHNTDFDGNSD